MSSLIALASLALIVTQTTGSQTTGNQSPRTTPVLGGGPPPRLQWRKVLDGPTKPADIRQAPGDDTRWFVASTREGIYVIENGVLLPEKFLDLSAVLHPAQGLASLAFHPDYQKNGRFFVTYQDADLKTFFVEYSVSADPNVADPGSAINILGPHQGTGFIHNWNQIHFGTDGMLYVALGDSNPGWNISMDLGEIHGKILRLDMDSPGYIPADNPFVGVSGAREEVWHYGLREVWKFCIDPLTQDMFIADVGRNDVEELNVAPAGASGMNFGWWCLEGTQCSTFGGACAICVEPTWVDPIYEYTHDEGCAIMGGYVYRGTEIPHLSGAYFFADWCTSRIYSIRYDGSSVTGFADRTDSIVHVGGDLRSVATFGLDNAGELYAADYLDGEIYKLELAP